jgi:hypothetical protein
VGVVEPVAVAGDLLGMARLGLREPHGDEHVDKVLKARSESSPARREVKLP